MTEPSPSLSRPMTDPFGRSISYLRVSVTDRCDLRCFYCMAEDMHFLPKADLLTLEELDRLCSAFIAKGVRKLRLTGGEPLVRRNVMSLVRSLSRHLQTGALRELTMTTNGTQLARFAAELRDCGVKRINVSLDTLDPERFVELARREHPGGCAVAVSHGDPITILRVVLSGRPLTVPAIRGADYAGLCSVTEIVYEPGADRPRVAYLTVPWNLATPAAVAD